MFVTVTLDKQPHKFLLLTGLTVLALLGVWLPLPHAARIAAATLLALALPGWALLRAIRLTLADRLAQLSLAIGLSYAVTTIIALGLLYIGGKLSAAALAVTLGGFVVGLALLDWLRGGNFVAVSQPASRLAWLFFALPVFIAAFLSFTNLGYTDYWNDEMNGLLRAIAIIGGRPETIFEHTKGPVEVLLPAVFGLLSGGFSPLIARFPFALAFVVGIGGYYLLARHLVGRNIGLLAALLMAINGLELAFARMVQYQAVVFLMMSLSLLLVYHFSKNGRVIYLGLGLFLVGVGVLAHYDMLLVLPPLGYLLWQRYGRQGTAWQADGLRLAGAGFILAVVIASFYLPFLLHPNVSETSTYLARRISSDSGWPGNNFDQLYTFSILYNSSYYLIFVALLGLGTIAGDLVRLVSRHYRDRRLWAGVGLTFLLSLLALVANRPSFIPLFSFTLLFVLLIFSAASAERRFIYVWLSVTFIGYIFLIDYPRTHLRMIYPAWLLLAALAARDFVLFLGSTVARRRVMAGAAVGLGLLFAGYEYLLFVDSRSEYIFTYPAHKSLLYWEDPQFPFGSRRLYGTPHRLGWQMINQLFAQGVLAGDWNSNDDGTNLFWYTLGSPRNPCYPRYYVLTQFEQKDSEEQNTSPWPLDDYTRIGQVWNYDRLQLELYEFAPINSGDNEAIWTEPATYNFLVTPTSFQSLPYLETPPVIPTILPAPAPFRPAPSALQQIAATYGDPRIEQVRDTVELAGYEVDNSRARPGGLLVLTLYWRAVEPVNLSYKIFAHLETTAASPQVVAQADDLPNCGTVPTQQWQVGQIVADRHVIRLPAELSPGEYIFQVGLYEPQTGLRMDWLDAMSNPQGNSFALPPMMIKP